MPPSAGRAVKAARCGYGLEARNDASSVKLELGIARSAPLRITLTPPGCGLSKARREVDRAAGGAAHLAGVIAP
jgi:hypothetical protein